MFDVSASLQWVNGEANAGAALFSESLDEERMKSGGAGAGIDLAFDPLDAKLGKSDPFPPPNSADPVAHYAHSITVRQPKP